jgi:hypothetical protein
VSSLRDSIVQAAAATEKRSRDWTDSLPDEVRAELMQIRREWRAGSLVASGRGLAAAIVANCRERGIPCLTVSGVREWLMRKG